MAQYREITKRLMSQYLDTTRVDDPETFLTSVLTVMTHYPLEIADQIADPFGGLPARQNRLPTPYDVRQLGDELMAPIQRELERQRRHHQQALERNEIERLERERPRRQTLAQIEEDCAARGVYLASYRKRCPWLFGTDGKLHTDTSESVAAKLGITELEFDMLPDQPPRKEESHEPPRRDASVAGTDPFADSDPIDPATAASAGPGLS